MSERFVLATVQIRTEGRLCAEARGAACPYLDMTFGACRLFFDDVEPAAEGGPLRVERCLALDGGGVGEPNGVGDAPALPHRCRRRGAAAGLPWPGVRAPARGRRREDSPQHPHSRGRLDTMAKLYRRGATWWISWSREERESARTKDKQAAELVLRRRERERADPVHAAAQAANDVVTAWRAA